MMTLKHKILLLGAVPILLMALVVNLSNYLMSRSDLESELVMAREKAVKERKALLSSYLMLAKTAIEQAYAGPDSPETRQQVLDYMSDNSGASETDRVAEAERYMAIPGQALGYKIGELKIIALREKAKQALGDKFDIRQFHAQVLGEGSLPLDVLEARIDRWIAARKAG